jgi:hypothetical protein
VDDRFGDGGRQIEQLANSGMQEGGRFSLAEMHEGLLEAAFEKFGLDEVVVVRVFALWSCTK